MSEELATTRKIASGPSYARFLWMRFLCDMHIMPRITITCAPDELGRTLKIRYRVHTTYALGDTRKFRGVAVAIHDTALKGSIYLSSDSSTKLYWNPDEIYVDMTTGEGKIEVNTANPFRNV